MAFSLTRSSKLVGYILLHLVLLWSVGINNVQAQNHAGPSATSVSEQDLFVNLAQAQDSLEYYYANEDTPAAARVHSQMGELYNRLEAPVNSLAHLHMSLDHYQQMGKSAQVIQTLHRLAAIYADERQFEQALQYARRAGDLARQLKNDSLLAASAYRLGKVYERKGMGDKALQSYKVALEYYMKMDRSTQQADLYHQLAELYNQRGDVQQALAYHRQALELRQQLEDSLGLAESFFHMGKIFSGRDDLDLARNHYERAAHIHEKLNRPVEAGRTYLEIGTLAVREGDYNKALEYADRALPKAAGFDALEVKVEALKLALDSHQKLGNTQTVSLVSRQLQDLQDSLEQLKREQAVRDASLEYQVNNKLEELQLLKEKQALQEARIEWEESFLAFSVIALVLLVVISTLLYNRYQYRKRAEEKLKANNSKLEGLNTRLEKLNKEKNEILSTVSHDLKNPLSGITGLTSLVKMDPDGTTREELLDYIEQIDTVAQRMDSMIRQLLDVRAIDSGRNNLHIGPLNVTQAVQQVLAGNESTARKKNIELIGDGNFGVSHFALGDETAIRRVLDNFISNAIKYSSGETEVRVMVKEEGEKIRVEVEDQGPGLSESDQEKLFTKFSRLSNQPTGGETSTGLGLYIARELAREMNGCVGVKTERGKGSTFYLELPKAELQEEPLLL